MVKSACPQVQRYKSGKKTRYSVFTKSQHFVTIYIFNAQQKLEIFFYLCDYNSFVIITLIVY